jgi:alpha-amylase
MANENRPDRMNFPGDAELQRYKLEQTEFEKDRLYGNLDEGLFSPWDFNTDGNIQNWMGTYIRQRNTLCPVYSISING